MEVLALVKGLKALKVPCRVNLYTGTEYVSDYASQLIRHLRSSFVVATVAAGTAKNADLWREFDELAKKHWVKVVWVRVRGRHADDSRARMAARWAA
jgi:ribonuclease HI